MIAGYIQEALAPIGFTNLYCLIVLIGHSFGFLRMEFFSRKAQDHQVNDGKGGTKKPSPSDRQRLIVEV